MPIRQQIANTTATSAFLSVSVNGSPIFLCSLIALIKASALSYIVSTFIVFLAFSPLPYLLQRVSIVEP